MNEHLKPVFEILLPSLENARVDYWVYGGVSIAAFNGEFFRKNKDVDVFVTENDFERTCQTLIKICLQNNFCTCYHPSKNDDKPKLEVKINNDEIMSVIPVFQNNNTVIFKYGKICESYPNEILEKVERNILGNKFFTPKNELIKKIFIEHIKNRPNKKTRKNIIKDAKVLLSSEEFSKIFNN